MVSSTRLVCHFAHLKCVLFDTLARDLTRYGARQTSLFDMTQDFCFYRGRVTKEKFSFGMPSDTLLESRCVI